MPFSRRGRRIARGRGAGVAAAGIASPRPPRRAPSSSPGRAPPAGSSTAPCGRGGDGARARARRARESGDERVRPRRDTRARDFDFSSTEEVSAARARGKKAALVAVAFSSRRRLRCIRVTPRRNGRRSQGRQTPQTRGAWPLTLGARPFATRRAPSIARSRLVDFLRSIPSARRESTRCLERSIDARSRLSPPFRSQPPLPSSRTLFTASYTRRRMAATTAAAAAAGSALPR